MVGAFPRERPTPLECCTRATRLKDRRARTESWGRGSDLVRRGFDDRFAVVVGEIHASVRARANVGTSLFAQRHEKKVRKGTRARCQDPCETPTVSRDGATSFTPANRQETEGWFDRETPQKLAGRMTEPPVCVPNAASTIPSRQPRQIRFEDPPVWRDSVWISGLSREIHANSAVTVLRQDDRSRATQRDHRCGVRARLVPDR